MVNKFWIMNKTFSLVFCAITAVTAAAAAPVSGNDVALRFNPADSTVRELVMPDGKTVRYRAYEHIYYVSNVEDSVYQYMNFYVPETVQGRGADVPIFLRTYVGGYMAAEAREPSATDASGRALAEGYVLCIPGSRGINSVVESGGSKTFTGRAPNGLLDLKAAVRYLRYNDELMPGDAERIITDGTSAGGAMSALLGTTGNSPLYEPYLREMGAADARDDVFASVCYCPIIDLDHADMAYEWLYSCTNDSVRGLNAEQKEVSEELAAAYPAYLESLQLRRPDDGTLLTADNYLDYLESYIVASAQRAKNEGCDIPSGIGIVMNGGGRPAGFQPDARPGRNAAAPGRDEAVVPGRNGGPEGDRQARRPERRAGQDMRRPDVRTDSRPDASFQAASGEFVVGVDMPEYLSYVATTQALKTPPAFDALGVLSAGATPENSLFGDSSGSASNFTAFSLGKSGNGTEPDAALQERVYMMNPMNFADGSESQVAQHWYIRHGARDRDTSFPVPVNFATKLMNSGYDVNFALPWNRPHSGDYNLDDLFAWISSIVE